jgi:hypothetical protein
MTKTRTRFRVGSTGICEGTLYEFTLYIDGCDTISQTRLVAAANLAEAAAHIAKAEPTLAVSQVRRVRLVEMISGAPLNSL